MCIVRLPLNSATTKVQGLVEASFAIHGGNLFKSIPQLPKSIRNLTNVDLPTFKRKLDGYLSSIADEPQSPGYTDRRRAASNSLMHMIAACKQ